MARIVIDGTYAHPGGTGLARYAHEVLSRLFDRLDDHELLLLAPSNTLIASRRPALRVPAAASPQLGGIGEVFRALWQETALPALLRKQRIDLYYSPVPELPLIRRSQAIATVHDLIPLDFPRIHWKRLWLFHWNLVRVRSRASTVVAISEYTRDRVIARWQGRRMPPIKVVPNGTSTPGRPAEVTDKDKIPYVLFVGDARPYKGLATLVRALSCTQTRVRLRVAGRIKAQWLRKLGLEKLPELSERIDLLNFVDEPQLERLYRDAAAVVCPSLQEGFGLVPLEAMRRGTPALVSDIQVFRETVTGYARFLPPDDPGVWAEAIDSVVESRSTLSRESLMDFASTYDWDCTAAGIENIIRAQLGEKLAV